MVNNKIEVVLVVFQPSLERESDVLIIILDFFFLRNLVILDQSRWRKHAGNVTKPSDVLTCWYYDTLAPPRKKKKLVSSAHLFVDDLQL
jgi:hypothetical protein